MEPNAAPADHSPDTSFSDGMPYPLAEIDRVLAVATGREIAGRHPPAGDRNLPLRGDDARRSRG